MARRRAPASPGQTVRKRPSSVGTVAAENGRKVTQQEAERSEPNAALSAGAKAALGAIGGWIGLDWDETIDGLERIRAESKPSPPIEDL